jgi:molecular chaperone DnaK (HSP70)
MQTPENKLAYGIDFGTTNSTISVVDSIGKPQKLKIDPEAPNPAVMRSVIYVSPQMKFLFGKPAVDAYITDIALGKGSKKKIIETGRMIKLSSPASLGGFVPDKWVPEIIEVEESEGGRLLQALKSNLSSDLVSYINLFGNPKPLEWVVGQFLKEMKERADEILGKKIDKVILGRPVEYVGGNNALAIERMRKAAEIAGFKEVEFEFEPIGAAYDYGFDVKTEQTA